MRNFLILSVLFFSLFLLTPPCLMAHGAAKDTDWQKGYTLIITSTDKVQDQNALRDKITRYGARIAVMFPTHVMLGWVPDNVQGRLQDLNGIELITKSPVDAAAMPYRDSLTLAGVNAYNYIVTGQSVMEADYGQQHKGLPLIGDVHPNPAMDRTPGPNGKIPTGNSDAMTGTVAVCLFFVESNGSIDPNSYTWNNTDQTNTINRAAAGLSWWNAQAPSYGKSVTYSVYFYAWDSSYTSQGYEPILHASGDPTQGLWIDPIMHNLGYTTGDYFQEVTDFNTWLKGAYGTNWAYSVFIAYNPAGAPTTFTDGYFAYAYYGGPFSQMCFNNDGWGEASFGQVLTHETGHIFWACDEYYQAGYGGCTDCGICISWGPRPCVNNGNCEYCNASSVACMMRSNEYSLCSYTPDQIGWGTDCGGGGCTYSDQTLSNGVPVNDSIDCTTQQGGWKYYSFTVPAGATNLSVDLYNLTADADLYLRYGSKPDLGSYDCRPYNGGTNDEQCTNPAPTAGTWWVGINNYATTTINYTVMASWTDGGGSCLFCDDFEDGSLDVAGWTYLKGIWNEGYGYLYGWAPRKAIAIALPAFWGCDLCSFEATISTDGGWGNRVWMMPYYWNKSNTLELMMKQENGKFVLKQRLNGKVVAKNKYIMPIAPYVNYDVYVTFDGTWFDVWIDYNYAFSLLKYPGSAPFGTATFASKGTTGWFGYISVN